ncbi:Cell division protein FtsN [Raoultella terrigena]|uniref:Cell division protein FtsN n=1 Tax=Raoultella terrigena TaxID=577 RepID=A0A4U9D3C1_RAOTE|nr:Cell division protein FtsN [Raoultella terrigena]
MKPEQLTNEQRQLLAQMQADMRQQPTQLTEVPWNEQTPAQRQQTLQRQRLAQQQVQQQQWAQTQQQAPVQQPRVQQRVVEQPAQQPKPVQQPKQTAAATQPYQDLLQTPAHTAAHLKHRRPRRLRELKEAPKAAAEKKDDRSWMIQCGSFKGAEQAETVRAQLAFEGFASHITTNNGWNRVVIGPLKGKENANDMIGRLKMAGMQTAFVSPPGVETLKIPPSIMHSAPRKSAGPLFRFCNQGVCS